MKRILTSAVGVTLGLLTLQASAAEEIEWRAALPPSPGLVKKAPPAVPPFHTMPIQTVPAQPAQPVRTVVKTVIEHEPTSWRGARGQSPDDSAVITPANVSAPSQLPASLPKSDPLFPADPLSKLAKPKPQPVTTLYEVPPPVPATMVHSPKHSQGSVVESQPFGSPELQIVDENLFGLDPLGDNYSADWYVQAEYLLWWVKPAKIPAAATTNLQGGDPIIGNPGTVLLLGPEEVGTGARSGARLRAGAWLDPCHKCGIDAGLFFVGPVEECYTFDSTRFPIIGRPFFAPNQEIDGPFIETVASPGIATGRLDVCYDSFLWGGDINYRECLFTTCDSHASAFIGYRYLNLDESLSFRETLVAGPQNQNVAPGTRLTVFDEFSTNSQFHGAQIGARYERYLGRLVFDARGSVAIGATQNLVEVNGQTTLQQPGQATQVVPAGLLAVDSNSGRRTFNEFSVVPELTLNVGYQLTDQFRFFGGYNFLYWTNVVRPGDQIDTNIDVTRVPFFIPPGVDITPFPQPRPAPLYNPTDFWAMGLNFGFEYRW